jgi:hypothetical protein
MQRLQGLFNFYLPHYNQFPKWRISKVYYAVFNLRVVLYLAILFSSFPAHKTVRAAAVCHMSQQAMFCTSSSIPVLAMNPILL